MKIIAGSTHSELAKNIAHLINAELTPSIVHKYENSELKVKVQGNLEDQKIIIIQSICNPANDNLMELLLLVDAVRRNGANQITIIIPYFGYSRQDRAANDGSPLSIDLVARLIESTGVNKIITLDLHSSDSEKFFKIPIINLSVHELFASSIDISQNPVIVSPDRGSIMRAEKISKVLKCDLALITKSRDYTGICQMIGLKGEVKDRHCIIIDDIIDTGNTICKAADFLIQQGASSIEAFITHGVFSSGSSFLIESSNINKIYVTNTIVKKQLSSKFKQISIDSLFANTLSRYIV